MGWKKEGKHITTIKQFNLGNTINENERRTNKIAQLIAKKLSKNAT